MKRWYVVQIYAGYEQSVKADLQKRIEEFQLQDLFGDVLIPSVKMKQFFGDADSMRDQQLFPGYLLIEMEAVPEAIKLVTSIPRVYRLLGGKDPIPLSKKEIDRVIAQTKGEVAIVTEKHDFEIGKEIEIKEGPFVGFVGIIDSIDEENEKLAVMVSILGRMTPVEIGFDQVKR